MVPSVLVSVRTYCRLERAVGTTVYQIKATAVIASPNSVVCPLNVSPRNTTIAMPQRIHCRVVLCILYSFALFVARSRLSATHRHPSSRKWGSETNHYPQATIHCLHPYVFPSSRR